MIGIRRVAAGIGVLISVLLSFWAGAKGVLDLVGRALAVEDFSKPDGLVARGALWLFDTPWWVPAVLATTAVLAMLLLIYLSIRDGRINTTAPPTSNEKFRALACATTISNNRLGQATYPSFPTAL
jgi:hypothetical protein